MKIEIWEAPEEMISEHMGTDENIKRKHRMSKEPTIEPWGTPTFGEQMMDDVTVKDSKKELSQR